MNKKLIRSLNTLFGVTSIDLALSMSTSSSQAQDDPGGTGCENVIDYSSPCLPGATEEVGAAFPYCVSNAGGCCQYARRNQRCKNADGIYTGGGYKAYYRSFLPGGTCSDGKCSIPNPGGGELPA